MSAPSTKKTRGKWQVLLLLICLFLLISSGRMDSGDANAELASSINLVETGSLGTATAYSDGLIQSLFVRAPNGRYYEAHDIGNSLLLTPAVFGGHALYAPVSRVLGTTNIDARDPLTTLIAKTLASLIETMLSAVGCFYMYLLFGLFYKGRPALILTGLFAFATFYAGYFRSAWDVLPASNVVIILLFYSARLLLTPVIRGLDAARVAVWCGMACMFRLSLAPFLGLGILLLFWGVRKKLSRSTVLSVAAAAVVMFVPTLIFNALRTGSPLRPANTLPQFHYQTSLSGSWAQGLFGLLLSPNHGLFVYSPLLLLLVFLPWYWKLMPPVLESLLKAYLPAAFFYYLMIARMLNWGAAGLGPRYLLPLLPILFLPVGAIACQLWSQSRLRRLLVLSLCSISLVLSIPMLLVDHSNAVLRQYPDAMTGTTLYPVQHIAVWRDLLTGLHGRPVQTRANVGSEEETKLLAVFPDLLVMRVHQIVSGQSKSAGQAVLLLYVGALGCTLCLLWSCGRRCETVADDELISPGGRPLEEDSDLEDSDPAWKKPGIAV
jgi:hypothetical protein